MNKLRYLYFLSICCFGIILIWILYQGKTQTPFKSTLTVPYQVIGKSTQSVNRALSKIIPINDLDEKEYGMAIAHRYASQADTNGKTYYYLNEIIENMSLHSKKPFKYSVFVLPYSFANAFALPGGVILVTEGLLNAMKSEAEIVSILAHEMGHIERGHCFNAVKYEILFSKFKSPSLGKLADFAIGFALRHSFSKTQENEADEYAYDLVLLTEYDPLAVSSAFMSLHKYTSSDSLEIYRNKRADIFNDYFITHPPLPLRIEKFNEKGKMWWKNNALKKRYIGKDNLKNRICFTKMIYDHEWITRK